VPSFRVRVGDIITIEENSLKKVIFEKISEKIAKKNDIPSWLAVDAKKNSGKILNVPVVENSGFDVKSIIEFYSRKV
jgi:ribosomal protein S4